MELSIAGKQVTIYGEAGSDAPLVVLHATASDGAEVYELARSLTDVPFTMAVISGVDWNHDLCPWDCPPVHKKAQPCTGGAEEYLAQLTGEILPAVEVKLGVQPAYRAIAGYSLGGLFAIYSLYHCDTFSRAVSASGSLWYPNFLEHVQDLPAPQTDRVYFSLGDKETRSRNPLLVEVQNRTEAMRQLLSESGAETIFEMNPGNHFTECNLRTAKGIAWIIR